MDCLFLILHVHISGNLTPSSKHSSNSSSTSGVEDDTIHSAVRMAAKEVDAAVNATINNLFGYHGNEHNPHDHGSLMRLLRFPDESARTIARAADVYERTLTHIKKHVQAGLKMNLTQGQ